VTKAILASQVLMATLVIMDHQVTQDLLVVKVNLEIEVLEAISKHCSTM
jgi:hypothetical protein